MNKVYLLLGSNMGNSLDQLQKATRYIGEKAGKVIRTSAFYTTAAWGNTDQPDFLNQVIVIETTMDANKLLRTTLSIEKKMGRVRTVKNAPRIIDIDILFYNKAIIRQPDLVIPHPQIQHRRFVLIPLNEIAPGFKHPVLHQSVHALLQACTDPLDVKKF